MLLLKQRVAKVSPGLFPPPFSITYHCGNELPQSNGKDKLNARRKVYNYEDIRAHLLHNLKGS
jgi:hypothetical protein